jgi:hypothetical protein
MNSGFLTVRWALRPAVLRYLPVLLDDGRREDVAVQT